MNINLEKKLNLDGSTDLNYTITLGYSERASFLINEITKIATDNDLSIDELYYTSSTLQGYGGDTNILLDFSIRRASTPDEILFRDRREENKRKNEKEHALAEIERLKRVIKELETKSKEEPKKKDQKLTWTRE